MYYEPRRNLPENSMIARDIAAPADRRLLRRVLTWAVLLCLSALAFRHLVIEFQPVVGLCVVNDAPWWCVIRQAIIQTFYSDGIGIISLCLGLVALFGSRTYGPMWAIATIVLAAPSIVLYSADYAVPAFLMGLIRLLRD